ncbi:MAG: F0F1 ATP synthase subunit epsilon [bacterium]
MSFHLRILGPDRVHFDEAVSACVLPGVAGSFGVLTGHVPLVAALGTGLLKITRADGGEVYFVIDGGLAEVAADKTVALVNQTFLVNDPDSAQSKLAELRVAALSSGLGRG